MGMADEVIQRALSGQGLGKTPNLSHLRRGADSLPGRQLGGGGFTYGIPNYGPMHNLNPTMGQVYPDEIPWWDLALMNSSAPGGHAESMAYSMWQLAQRVKAQRAAAENGYPVSPASGGPIPDDPRKDRGYG